MLCNRYGHRTVGICSGLLACVTMVISAFAPNLMVLYFVYGLGAGTNFNLSLSQHCLHGKCKHFVFMSVLLRSVRGRETCLSCSCPILLFIHFTPGSTKKLSVYHSSCETTEPTSAMSRLNSKHWGI